LLAAWGGKADNGELELSGQGLAQWAAHEDGPLGATNQKLLELHGLNVDNAELGRVLFVNSPEQWALEKLDLAQSAFAFSNVLSKEVIEQIMTEQNVVVIFQTVPYKANSEASKASFTDEAFRRMGVLKPDECLLIEYNVFNVYFIIYHFWRMNKVRGGGTRTTSIAQQAHKYPNRVALSYLILLMALKMRPPSLPRVRVMAMKSLFAKLPVHVRNLANRMCELHLSGHVYSLVACINGVKADGDRAIDYFATAYGVDICTNTPLARKGRELFKRHLNELIVWINVKYKSARE